MRVLKFLLLLILLLVVIGVFLPSSTSLGRSIVINQPQAQVFEHLNSMGNFNSWSPWYKLDPEANYVVSGTNSGVGSKLTWASEKKEVGSGSQEIVESQPNDRIKLLLDFGPQGKADAAYTLKPDGDGTQVTWNFKTDHGWNLISRYAGLMIAKMLAPSYEEGMMNLKRVLEQG